MLVVFISETCAYLQARWSS